MIEESQTHPPDGHVFSFRWDWTVLTVQHSWPYRRRETSMQLIADANLPAVLPKGIGPEENDLLISHV